MVEDLKALAVCGIIAYLIVDLLFTYWETKDSDRGDDDDFDGMTPT